MPTLVILSFILMGKIVYVWSISFLLLQALTMGIFEPVLRNNLNLLVPSEIRATMLSVQSIAGNLLFAAVAPFLGLLVDLYSLQTALLLFAAMTALFSLFLWWYWIRLSKIKLLSS